jgi:hypothetical protein
MAWKKYLKGKNFEINKKYNPPPISKATRLGPHTKEANSATQLFNVSISSLNIMKIK